MKILIAYYTRTGNTKKAAEAVARALHAASYELDIEEIVDTKSRGGVVGFLGAGKDSTLKRDAEIQPVKAKVGEYDLVIAGTPIWAWNVTPPVRSFLAAHADEIRQAAFFCTMMGVGAGRVFEAMEEAVDRTALATAAFVDRHVRKGDEVEFLGKVEEFVGDVVRAIGRGGVPARGRPVRAGGKERGEAGRGIGDALGKTSREPPETEAGGRAPDSGPNVIAFETSAAFLERFDGFRRSVLRSVAIAHAPGRPSWSARIVLSARDLAASSGQRCRPDREAGSADEGDERGPRVDVTLTVENVKELRMSESSVGEVEEAGEKHEDDDRNGEASGDVLTSGIRIGFVEMSGDELVYVDLRPRSDSAQTLSDFMRSGLMIAGTGCTWEVGPRAG